MIGVTIDRRGFIIRSSLFLALRMKWVSSQADSSAVGKLTQSSGVHSTAEEVTAGLDLTGRTALLTGCNAGIGYETLRVLVLRGAHVYGLARNMEKAERACTAVTGAGIKGKATPFACEQTDFSSVVACADAVRARGVPIDMLICNAGIYGVPTLELVQGVEKQFAVNHLSHFILVNRLLNLVTAAHQGRIVVVGSDVPPEEAKIDIEFDNLSGQRSYDARKMYHQSKLANALFVRELAQRLSRTRVTANGLTPGLVKTEHALQYFQSNDNVDLETVREAKTVEQGAATTCYVATNPALARVSGAFFEECNVVVPGGHIGDAATAQKLWAISDQLTRPYLSKSNQSAGDTIFRAG